MALNGSKKAANAPAKRNKKTAVPRGSRTREERYVLCLYVTGMTSNSVRAVENIKAICEEYLRGRYELEIIDVYKQPALAKGEQIVAAPTLIKKLPLPVRRLVGDFSHKDRVLLGLDIVPKK